MSAKKCSRVKQVGGIKYHTFTSNSVNTPKGGFIPQRACEVA